METTLCLIKPDAVRSKNVGNILSVLEGEFHVADITIEHMTTETAKRFYQEHEGKDFYDRLVKFMASGPVYAVALQGPDAVIRLRSFMGETDPQAAKVSTLRALFGTEIPYNAVHGSDSVESAGRELEFFFGG